MAEKAFRHGSYTSIELNTSTKAPEWNNQKMTMMGEDDAFMTEKGFDFPPATDGILFDSLAQKNLKPQIHTD